MIKTRLVGLLSHAKKYIVYTILWQWTALLSQVIAVFTVADLLERVVYGAVTAAAVKRTIFTLAIGFQGGEVTPLFSIGTSLGVILGGLLGLPPMLCAALGYAAVFGSATNTLIAPIMIGLEVFGGADMVLFVIVCVIAYGVNGNISIYAQEKF